VSQFAAGCAICGADLQAARAAQRRPAISDSISGLRPARLPFGTSSEDLLIAGVLAVLLLFAPLIGFLVAAWIAYHRNREGDLRVRNLAAAFLVLCLVMLALPGLRYGILFELLN
jgi:hypothetical protein